MGVRADENNLGEFTPELQHALRQRQAPVYSPKIEVTGIPRRFAQSERPLRVVSYLDCVRRNRNNNSVLTDLEFGSYRFGVSMAGSRVSPVPVAFLLALASETGSAVFSPTADTSQLLKRGSFSNLLNAAELLEASNNHEQKSLKHLKTAQYFPNFPNFRNCFSGNWRNC
jgi:hypothetical protein